jgi:hypothetical protein
MVNRYMVLRDKRLMGGVPARRHFEIFNLSAAVSLRAAFVAINRYASGGRIDTLFILCHGYAGVDRHLSLSLDAGGMGLQLGREGVKHENVGAWREVRGKIKRIVIYACAASDTQPGNELTKADGKYLMGALALATGADVYAADRIQWYRTFEGLRAGAFDFGEWEGTLSMFSGESGLPRVVHAPPVELSRVFRGTAP